MYLHFCKIPWSGRGCQCSKGDGQADVITAGRRWSVAASCWQRCHTSHGFVFSEAQHCSRLNSRLPLAPTSIYLSVCAAADVRWEIKRPTGSWWGIRGTGRRRRSSSDGVAAAALLGDVMGTPQLTRAAAAVVEVAAVGIGVTALAWRREIRMRRCCRPLRSSSLRRTKIRRWRNGEFVLTVVQDGWCLFPRLLLWLWWWWRWWWWSDAPDSICLVGDCRLRCILFFRGCLVSSGCLFSFLDVLLPVSFVSRSCCRSSHFLLVLLPPLPLTVFVLRSALLETCTCFFVVPSAQRIRKTYFVQCAICKESSSKASLKTHFCPECKVC